MDLFGVIILATAAGHGVLLAYIAVRRRLLRPGGVWLALAVALSALTSLTYFVPAGGPLDGRLNSGFGLALGLAALMVVFGALVIRDVLNRRGLVWLGVGALWLGGLALAGLVGEPVLVGQPEWLAQFVSSPDVFSLTALIGLVAAGIFVLAVSFYGFYIARLPEVANRGLFWVLDAAALLLGVVLVISGPAGLLAAGSLVLLMSMTGAVYALVSYRVFDIRGGLAGAARALWLVLFTALFVAAALVIFDRTEVRGTRERAAVIAALALMAAAVYVLLRQGLGRLTGPLLGAPTDPTRAARRYSQQVSKAVELENLIAVGSETLNSVMGVRRSGMILVNDASTDSGRVELLVMRGGGFVDVRDPKGFIEKAGPVYQRLAAERAPLSQFDLEFSPRFRAATAGERAFFAGLQMSAYAPIIVEDVLIGVLACGAKTSDAPFFPHDLELLATMADQTGVALRNARLVADLRHLNATMKSLNAGLEEANEQLANLDKVKTDFVTIASHELRTPLAQLRGYVDIVDALNEQGMLDKDQTSGMVGNLRRAAQRMDELISAMLDVSQLDVNAMDLRLTQTPPETIIRMAIEPLTDALNQRKISLSVRGTRGLPPIQADMQRLVQAFRNIVVNAIKFTPDKGRIEITASLQAAEGPGESDNILVAISDTGVGIDKANLELIFQKFFRASDPSLHSTGTYKFMGAGPGLGLTIARGVIEGHGGKIWAESSGHNIETCPGSTFYVLLPVSPPEDARRILPFEDHAPA